MSKFTWKLKYTGLGRHYHGKDYMEVCYYWLWFKVKFNIPIQRYE